MRLIGSFSVARIVARALFRSARRRRARILTAVGAGVCGVALSMAVFVISWSVLDAIRDVRVASIDPAAWAIVTRSSSGMDSSALDRAAEAVPEASVAPVILANTRLAGAQASPFLLVGATPELMGVLDEETRAMLRRLPLLHEDEMYLTSQAARHHGVAVGDALRLQTPRGVRSLKVVGLIGDAFANRGEVGFATLATVARAFQRPHSIDVVFVRAPASRDAARTALERAVGGVATVVPPEQLADGWTKSFRSLRALLAIFAFLALLTSAGVMYFAWRLTIEEQRITVGRFRLVGARRRDLGSAAVLLVIPLFLLCLVVGAPLGLALGAGLSGFSERLVTLAQLAAQPQTPVVKPLLATAVVAGATMACAWLAATVQILRVPVIESITSRRATTGPTRVRGVKVVGAAAIGASIVLLSIPTTGTRVLAGFSLVAALLAASVLAPLAISEVMTRAPRRTVVWAGRELRFALRRNSALVAVMAIAVAMAIGLGGASGSLRDRMSDNVRAWTQADLFVDAALPGENLQDDKFSPALRGSVDRTPGLAAAGWFSQSAIDMGRTRVALWSWGSSSGIPGLRRLVRLDVVAGPRDERFWEALDRGDVAVSANYARLHDVDVGDVVVVPGQTRSLRLRVASVVDDLVSDAGVIFTSDRMYRRLTGDHRPFQYMVALAPGANADEARSYLKRVFTPAYPNSVVWDQKQIRAHFTNLTSSLLLAFGLVSKVLFLLALLVGATAIAASVGERRRSLAIARLDGASTKTLWRQLVIEYLALSLSAWLAGLCAGLALVPSILNLVAVTTGLLPPVEVPWTSALAMLPVSVALVVGALFLAMRQSRAFDPISVAIGDE